MPVASSVCATERTASSAASPSACGGGAAPDRGGDQRAATAASSTPSTHASARGGRSTTGSPSRWRCCHCSAGEASDGRATCQGDGGRTSGWSCATSSSRSVSIRATAHPHLVAARPLRRVQARCRRSAAARRGRPVRRGAARRPPTPTARRSAQRRPGRDVHHQPGDPLTDPLRDRAEVGLAALAPPDEQDDELLAAEAPDEVALTHLGTQGRRRRRRAPDHPPGGRRDR